MTKNVHAKVSGKLPVVNQCNFLWWLAAIHYGTKAGLQSGVGEIEVIPVILFIDYCIIFHKKNYKPTLSHSVYGGKKLYMQRNWMWDKVFILKNYIEA